MSRKALAAYAVVLVTATGLAKADVPPWSGPPEFLDQVYGEQIRKAGYDCPRVIRAEPTREPAYQDLRWGSQSPLVVGCDNNKRFLVAVAPKRPLNSREPPPPAPAERIRPL